MNRDDFTRQERWDAVIALSIALFYLASAVLNTLFSLVLFIILVGAAMTALGARSYSIRRNRSIPGYNKESPR